MKRWIVTDYTSAHFLLYSEWVISDGATRFTERECMRGGLGRFNAIHAFPLMLAHALKLKKFGA